MQLPGRAVSLVNAGVAAVLVAVLAAVALVVKPPAPPGIAEFAPRATKPITKAPAGQVGQLGRAPGGHCAAPFCSPTPRPTPSLVGRSDEPDLAKTAPQNVQCYTWPDGTVTQTFDPQSPPCIAAWLDVAKGNGGATSRGVSATEIRVGLPVRTMTSAALVTRWVAFFNTHFQLYGRRLVLVPFLANQDSPSQSRAAAAAAEEQRVFASLDQGLTIGVPGPEYSMYADGLADRHILSVTGGGGYSSEAQYASHHPFQWAYRPPQDTLQRATAEMVCRQLVGHPARNSREFSTATRSFASLVPEGKDGVSVPTKGYREGLAGCGVRAPVYEVNGEPGHDRTLLVQLRSQGITTVLTVNAGNAAPANTADLMTAASQVAYFPEWIISGGLGDEDEAHWSESGSAGEARGLFGVAAWNRFERSGDTPCYQAHDDAGGGPPDSPTLCSFYNQLQILATGIQTAGPRLTPSTFGQGLQSTSFANPGSARRPSYQATVGFGGDHVQIDDFALAWWNTTGRSRQLYGGQRSPGAFCYVDNATRWRIGEFPSQDRFFAGQSSQC